MLWRTRVRNQKPRKLHIGGEVRSEGWEVLNAIRGPHVDHVGDAGKLSRFAEHTFSEIYASHVLEHLDYCSQLPAALDAWHRILKPGGTIYISVPDLDVLAAFLLEKQHLTIEDRFHVMRMMFGGQLDEYDYHVAGLNQEFLTEFMQKAGFINIRRVKEFGLFDDGSSLKFKGVPISLNLMAEKTATA